LHFLSIGCFEFVTLYLFGLVPEKRAAALTASELGKSGGCNR